VLEAVHVNEQRAGQSAGPARGLGDHVLRAVEHQRAVGQTGERVVEGLVGERAGLLPYQRQRSPASGSKDQYEQPEHQTEKRSAEQHHARVPVAERSTRGAGPGGLHAPAFVRVAQAVFLADAEADLGALRARRGPSTLKGHVRVASVVAEGHSHVRMALKGLRQHDVGCQQLADPSDECATAAGHRRRHGAAAIDGRLHSQRRGATLRERCIARLPRVAGRYQRWRNCAVIQAAGHECRGAPGQSRNRQAVVGAVARREDEEGFLWPNRLRAQRPDGVGGDTRFERRQARARYEGHETEHLELRVSLYRVHGFCPPVEVGSRCPRVALHEGAGADDEVFLVLDG
jgi:hypothetical protein